jgi:hypothetical protein
MSSWCQALMARGHSLEPVAEGDVGAFAELGDKAALAAKAFELPGPRAGDDEPRPGNRGSGQRALGLDHERPASTADAATDALDPHEARRVLRQAQLEDMFGAGATAKDAAARLSADSGRNSEAAAFRDVVILAAPFAAIETARADAGALAVGSSGLASAA